MKGQTVRFKNGPAIRAVASVAGPKECQGIIGKYVDNPLVDDMFGEQTYEKAECKMLSYVIDKCIKKAKLKRADLLISGDLLNQIISSSFAARNFDMPFLGVYSACSTMSESLAISALLIDGGYASSAVAATVSHFSSAERQYRYPLELGCTRPPQAQWTVTGAGGILVSRAQSRSINKQVKITSATFGRVVDFGVSDVNNMGAAMAPAAADTLSRHFADTRRRPDYYDLIVTGDLGAFGSRVVKQLMKRQSLDMDDNHIDCGEIVYNVIEDEFQGGSGAGCSAVVLASYVYDKMLNGNIKRVLFAATGALLSTVSSGQGESIPCICHCVSLETE